MSDNIDVFNFELSDEDMRKIDNLDRNETVTIVPGGTIY